MSCQGRFDGFCSAVSRSRRNSKADWSRPLQRLTT